MATSYGALCTDFYVEHKLALKMDLPSERETLLHFFDQVRKRVPAMNRLRRYEGELALESSRRATSSQWLALRRNNIRSGYINPDTMDQAYHLHQLVLESAPYHLTLSTLDVDFQEILFGFDLECKADHDRVVFDALFDNTPVAKLLNVPDAEVLDVQPIYKLALSESGDMQATFEVRTRPRGKRGSTRAYRAEPISVFLHVRKYGPLDHLDQLREGFEVICRKAEALANDRLIPNMLTPIVREITSSSA